MSLITRFSVGKVQAARKKLQRAARVAEQGLGGWQVSEVDPVAVVDACPPLKLRDGWSLCAYQYRSGENGNGMVWAIPSGVTVPPPHACPRETRRFLEPPRPPEAVDDVMTAITGDGTPWSYLLASLLARELWEFGAIWHGVSWGVETIVDPRDPANLTDDAALCPYQESDWTWEVSPPDDCRPAVVEDEAGHLVTFYTYSGLGAETVHRIDDRYSGDGYCFESERTVIAQGPGGFVF